MRPKALVLLLAATLLGGCASTSAKRLERISLQQTKAKVIENLGSPTAVRGCIINKYGEEVEVWEYRLDKGKTRKQRQDEIVLIVGTFGLFAPMALAGGEEEDYWLYFVNGRLVRWGEAGDWEKEAAAIYEIRFTEGEKLSQ